MATKLAETRQIKDSFEKNAPCAGAVPQTGPLSNLLKRKATSRALYLAGDALAFVAAHWTAKALLEHFLRVPSSALDPLNYAAFYLPFLLAALFVFERNQSPDLRRPEKELELVVKGVSLGFLLLVCTDFVVFRQGFSRYLMVTWYLLTLFAVLLERHGLRTGYGLLWEHEIGRRKTLLIGSTNRLFELQRSLNIQRYRRYQLLGIVRAGEEPLESFENHALPMLGTLDAWHEVAHELGAEQVIVALEESTSETRGLVADILKRCLAEGIDVQVCSDLLASHAFNYELNEYSGFFQFFAAPRWPRQVQIASKKMLDFAVGAMGSVLTVLVLPIVALIVKLEDGGPIFYRSAYVGPDGGNRYYLKFRTMRVDADKILEHDPELRRQFDAQCKIRRDPRVTRIGRFLRKYSVDEFPSFFSIFRGHISLVGPRTIMQIQKEKYGPALPKLLSVKPGLTGFWQIMGRQLTTHEERVRMDMFYIDHWSIWLDLWIIVKTFWKVVRAEGAY